MKLQFVKKYSDCQNTQGTSHTTMLLSVHNPVFIVLIHKFIIVIYTKKVGRTQLCATVEQYRVVLTEVELRQELLSHLSQVEKDC